MKKVTSKKFFLAIVLVFYLLLVGVIYRDLPKTLFQQDEWGAFSRFIWWQSAGKEIILKDLFFTDVAIHFAPFTGLLAYLQYRFFGLKFTPYAFFSLGLQLFNSLLAFYLAFLLFQRKSLAFVTGLLFAVNSVSHQVVSWMAATINSGGSCLFLLLSLIFSFQYLKQQKTKWFYFAILSLIISLGFKETSVFLFIFIPFFWLIFSSRKKVFTFKKSIFSLLLACFGYFALRLVLLINSAPYALETKRHLPPPKIVYFFRLMIVPLRAVSQSFFGERKIIEWAERVVKLAYPQFQTQIGTTFYDLVTQTITADLVSYSLSIFIIFISLIFFNYLNNLREKKLVQALIFAITFIPLSSLPFVFIPGRAGYFSLFEPRHLYISLIGSSILIALFLFSISRWLADKTKIPICVYFLLFLIPILLFHSQSIKRDLDILVARSQTRKEILTTIKNSYPDLPQRAVFYVESDTSYYGLPAEDKTLPFQTGPGRTLLIWYYQQEEFPGCFFEDEFLYGLPSTQGYRFCQGRGFGYFREYNQLVKTMKENQISPNEVFAFSWQGKTEEFKDITKQVRGRLKNE